MLKLRLSLRAMIIIALYSFGLSAQNIPNASFDSIYIGGIDRVYQWVTSDAVYFSNDTVVPFTPNTFFPPFSGNHHFLVKTVQVNYLDTTPAHYLHSLIIHNYPELKYPDGRQFNSFIVNGTHFYSDAMGYMNHSLGGDTFPHRPMRINGKYKYFDSLAPAGDFGKVEALLKKWNPVTNSIDTIGIAASTTELSPTAVWKPFSILFTYRDTTIPDSIVVLISASRSSKAPATLYIDDIYFDFWMGVDDAPVARPTITVFPNPCSDVIHVTPAPEEELPYRLYNLMGRIFQTGITTQGSVDVSSLPPGSYLLQLYFEDQSNILKFIKL